MSKNRMDKVIEIIDRKHETSVSSKVGLAYQVLKAITEAENMNLPELHAFYRLLFAKPEIKQFIVGRGVR